MVIMIGLVINLVMILTITSNAITMVVTAVELMSIQVTFSEKEKALSLPNTLTQKFIKLIAQTPYLYHLPSHSRKKCHDDIKKYHEIFFWKNDTQHILS